MVQTISEGWADYVGHTFAFMRYGNNVQDVETSHWLFDNPATNNVDERDVTGNYQQLLQTVPTYNNNFIPRGLFFDLTDADNPNENFDQIQGFTTNGIYQKLSPTLTTIQEFRDIWETDHPNVNNAALFDRYDID